MSDELIDYVFHAIGWILVGALFGAAAMLTSNGYEWLEKNKCKELARGVVLCHAFDGEGK